VSALPDDPTDAREQALLDELAAERLARLQSRRERRARERAELSAARTRGLPYRLARRLLHRHEPQ
jgi:hypothetical protein